MSEEAGGVVSFRDVKEERGIWCVGGEARGMPVTLRANDTKGGDQEGVCSTCRCGAGSNCLIHNFSRGWSHPDSFCYLSWQALQPPIQLG